MKKIYRIPALTTVTCVEEQPLLIVSGFDENVNTSGGDGTDILVKESDPISYNVWDDDWSK